MSLTVDEQIRCTADFLRCIVADANGWTGRWLDAPVPDVLEEARRLRVDDERVATLTRLLNVHEDRRTGEPRRP